MLKEKGYDTNTVRSWAKSQGLAVNDRGRIPDAIVMKYEENEKAVPPSSGSDNPAPKSTRKRGAKKEEVSA